MRIYQVTFEIKTTITAPAGKDIQEILDEMDIELVPGDEEVTVDVAFVESDIDFEYEEDDDE